MAGDRARLRERAHEYSMDEARGGVSDEPTDDGVPGPEDEGWCWTVEVDPWCPWTWRDFALPSMPDRRRRPSA